MRCRERERAKRERERDVYEELKRIFHPFPMVTASITLIQSNLTPHDDKIFIRFVVFALERQNCKLSITLSIDAYCDKRLFFFIFSSTVFSSLVGLVHISCTHRFKIIPKILIVYLKFLSRSSEIVRLINAFSFYLYVI